MINETSKIAAHLAATSLRFALTAQVAMIGNLVSSGSISPSQAADALNQTADSISGSLDRQPSELQAILIQPMRDHVVKLRELAEQISAQR